MAWLGGLFRRRRTAELVRLTSTPFALHDEVRIGWTDGPFALRLGGVVLEFHPDLPVTGDKAGAGGEWIVHTGAAFYEGVPEFIRIGSGKTTVLGNGDHDQGRVLGFDRSVASRHVRIANRKGELTVEPLDPDRPTVLSSIAPATSVWATRRENLLRLPGVLGRPLVAFDDDEALGIIQEVNEILADEAYRDRNDEGAPGGIIKFPDDKAVVIMGDVHARADNVLRLITEGGTLGAIERGEACLVFLGDLIHSEEAGKLEDMSSSLFILDMFCMLKRRFPANVFYVHGNHESFSPEVGKGGVLQGLLLRKYLKKRRGKEYVAEIEMLFDGLAYVVQGNEFAACHGGPVRSRVTRETLVNIRLYPGLQSEIVWNRLRQGSRVAGYGKGSVKRFRRILGLSDEATLVVGHTPMSTTETIWRDIGGIAGHHIIYSAHTHRLAAMVMRGGEATPLEFEPDRALDFLGAARAQSDTESR